MGENKPFLTRYRNMTGSFKVIANFGIIYIISQFIIITILEHAGSDRVLKLQTGIAVEYFKETMEYFRATGKMKYYIMHYYLDFLHPVWYSVLLSATLSWLFITRNVSETYN